MPASDTRRHWSGVGREIQSRTSNDYLAGDNSPYLSYKRKLFVTKLLSKVPVNGSALLEVGCGPGGNLAEIQKRRPARLAGCDIAPEMVDLAKRNVPGVDIRVAEGQALPYADGEFDIVMTVTVLQHNPDADAKQVLKEICRVARSQVFLFEDTSEPGPDTGAYQNYYGRLVPWFTENMSQCGFDLTDTQGLATYVSQRTSILLRRFDHAKTEGSQISRAHHDLEAASLPLTKHLDKVMAHWKWRLPQGFSPPELTMMAFRRHQESV